MATFHLSMQTMVCALLLNVTATSALARLGETESECDLRYGRSKDYAMEKAFPLIKGARHREYSLNGWQIHIAFVEGKAVREEYFKPASAGGPKFKADDVQAILEAEAGNGSWKVTETPAMFSLPWLVSSVVDSQKTAARSAMGKVWVRTDGALLMLRPGDSIVRVESRDATKIDESMKKQEAERQSKARPRF